jgi:hypothetical protein
VAATMRDARRREGGERPRATERVRCGVGGEQMIRVRRDLLLKYGPGQAAHQAGGVAQVRPAPLGRAKNAGLLGHRDAGCMYIFTAGNDWFIGWLLL